MAEVDAMPTFGSELKDGFKPANAWLGHGIAWLEDIQQFYRERAAIEKEYSAKLTALAKKYFDKKNKKTAQLSVGDTPAMTPGSLESASLTTWTTQLTTLESRANEHDRYANNLISQVAEPLKFFGGRFEELRKRHSDYATKLEQERDASYASLAKTKGKYDTVCQEVESKRKKTESHYDKAKAQNAYQQQLFEMNNAKNTYIIAINVTNKQKEKYYHEYVPEVMDSLQDLSEFRTTKLNSLWTVATNLESDMLQQSNGMVQHQGTEIQRNLPHLDSMMYIQHNMGAFNEPPDKHFEASPVWHDDGTMVVDETAKVFLRNVLGKSKSQLGELRREVDKKRREVESLKQLKQRVREGKEKKDEVEVVRILFSMQEDLHSIDRQRLTAEVETSTITSVVGDVTLGAKNHNFKSQTFKIPTNCDLCGERIWGLSAKGFDCRDCGYTCHSKCEMKVPPDCPGEQSKDERKKLKAERQDAANKLLKPSATMTSVHSNASDGPELTRSNTMTSLSSHSARPSLSGSISGQLSPSEETPPDAGRPSMSSAKSSGTMRKNRIMAPPPAAYITGSGAGETNGGTKEEKKGKMLYAFEASGEGELTVHDGRDVVLLEPDDGSGWVKVRAGYKEGLVPSSYVEFTTVTTPAASRSRSPTIIYLFYLNNILPSTINQEEGSRKALYEYTAQAESEHSMAEGERFVLVQDDPGDGWVEVEKAGVTGSVPASYVQAV
ncbi:hypothetical protein RAB80_002647 [Fusarium oxysporum f. sp. vasinfectum]|nr:hypothetical protein RAB80_002647 [Fusarium oxysporum f. sp. vasinfectum]